MDKDQNQVFTALNIGSTFVLSESAQRNNRIDQINGRSG